MDCRFLTDEGALGYKIELLRIYLAATYLAHPL